MSEHMQARAWREGLGLTRHQLADLTGYSYEAISLFESGKTPKRKNQKHLSMSAYVWHRYKRVCHSVECELRGGRALAAFGWGI